MENQRCTIILGISGGIAAYKVPQLIRLLTKKGIQVKTVLTQSAQPLVGIETLRTVSKHPVYTDNSRAHDMDHIRLAEWADYMVVCPATANTIAKIGLGIADNLLSSLALSFHGRLMLVPAMNNNMWNNPATQRNLAQCEKNGVRVLPVDSGDLACGTSGSGRMIDVERIADAIVALFIPKLLAGKRVLIASGATDEPLDPVRVLTNRSSGKMGRALASAARDMGAQVTVVSGPSSVAPPNDVTVVLVKTALQMHNALVARFPENDICIMAAAVSDFRPDRISKEKLHRSESENLIVTLVPNPDIAAKLGTIKTKKQMLIGFSLSTQSDMATARKKMQHKKCDLIIANEVHSSLGTDTCDMTILTAKKQIKLGVLQKNEAARKIVEYIANSVK